MEYVNCTPHDIKLNDGTVYESTGAIVRVSVTFSEIVDGVCRQEAGEVLGLPDPQDGVRYIVSGMVLAECDRADIVAPATGHPDVVRNDKGHIVSVPCLRIK